MSVTNKAHTKARRRVTALRKRLRRWIQKRDTARLVLALEGGEPRTTAAHAIEIVRVQQQLQSAIAQYKALKK